MSPLIVIWNLGGSHMTIIPFRRTWPVQVVSMPALAANSLSRGQEKRRIRESKVPIGNIG
jgi:hypothetical protein